MSMRLEIPITFHPFACRQDEDRDFALDQSLDLIYVPSSWSIHTHPQTWIGMPGFAKFAGNRVDDLRLAVRRQAILGRDEMPEGIQN